MPTGQPFKPLTLATGLSVAMIHANASASEPAAVFDPVMVTASRSAEPVSAIASTVQVIDQEAIRQQSRPGQKLADVLERLIPGMGPSTQTVTDRTQSIRGRKVLILIDGIPQEENRQISRQMNSIRPENVARIEVVSGASAIYGAGGTGGIINIITRKATEEALAFTTQAGFSVATNEISSDGATYTLSQSVSGKQGALDFLASAAFEQRNGFYDADGDRIAPEPAQVSRSDTDTRDLLLKLGYDLDEDRRLEASLQVFRDEMDSDYGPYYGNPDLSLVGVLGMSAITDGDNQAVKGLNLDSQPFTNRDSFSLSFTDADFYGSRLTAQTYYREREARFFPYAYKVIYPPAGINDLVVNQSTSEARVYGLKLVLDTDLSSQLKLAYGLDYDVDKGRQKARSFDTTAFSNSNGLSYAPVGGEYDYGPDVDTRTLGLFLQGRYQLAEDLVLRAGVRHERIRSDIGDYNPVAETWYNPLIPGNQDYTVLEGAEKKYQATLYNLGVVYNLNDHNDLFASYSEGFEVPDVARVLRNAVATTSDIAALPGVNPTSVDSANLDAVKVRNYELGWRGRWDTLQSAVTVFYNKSDQTVAFNDDYSVDLLDQKKKIYGIETSLDYFVTDRWSVGGSYVFTEGRTYDEDERKWLDLSAADVSPEKLTAYIAYERERFNVRLQSLTFADYDKGYSSGGNKESVDGYTTVDLLASFYLPAGRLDAAFSNLMNRDYQTVYSQWAQQTYGVTSAIPAQGRTFSLSYTVDY